MKTKKVMVCVTQQKTCERLIENGYKEIDNDQQELYVIHVVNEKDTFLYENNDGDALEYLFRVSKKVGADLTVIRSKDVIKAMVDFAKDKGITNIIMGSSPEGQDIQNHSIALKLKKHLPGRQFLII
ncbi:universal stress protein UspA [Clostridium sp. D2Q-11]|uniref:Universal stress protein UspA n=1 Tax=Anaeromonas frigoriresistens TaxID=2683708 RepID=A0A942Z7D4_9FIRM|nr:universal stress protein [Anaeromonas frigoriresistens]MBS4537143.1 universal stress protein UspA [Anaeromonas frigoriresistens]